MTEILLKFTSSSLSSLAASSVFVIVMVDEDFAPCLDLVVDSFVGGVVFMMALLENVLYAEL